MQITRRIRNQSHGPQALPPFIRATQLSNVILPVLREGSPRRIWACRLHCEHRMVTSGALSGMCKVFCSLDGLWRPGLHLQATA